MPLRPLFLAVLAPLAGTWAAPAATALPDPPDFLSAAQLTPVRAFESALEESGAAHGEYMGTLNERYIGALANARERMVKIGAARAATALDSEIGRIQAGDTSRSPDIDSAPDYVREMRGQYEQYLQRITALRNNRDGEARFVLDEALGELESELTRADEIDKAIALRDYRLALTRPPAPPAPPEPEPAPEVTPPTELPRPPLAPRPPLVPIPAPAEPEATPPAPDEATYEYGQYDHIPRAMTSEERAKYADHIAKPPTRQGQVYPVMLDSIRRGEVNEIEIAKIKKWGAARPQIYKGQPVWTATVTYPTISLFGTFDTEGMAIIDGDRVLDWIYTGSGQEIP